MALMITERQLSPAPGYAAPPPLPAFAAASAAASYALRQHDIDFADMAMIAFDIDTLLMKTSDYLAAIDDAA